MAKDSKRPFFWVSLGKGVPSGVFVQLKRTSKGAWDVVSWPTSRAEARINYGTVQYNNPIDHTRGIWVEPRWSEEGYLIQKRTPRSAAREMVKEFWKKFKYDDSGEG